MHTRRQIFLLTSSGWYGRGFRSEYWLMRETKPSLKPAAELWQEQFGTKRPIEVRAAHKGTLHDRLILIDRTTAWLLGQSFNHLATHSNTYLAQADPELAQMKIYAYEEV